MTGHRARCPRPRHPSNRAPPRPCVALQRCAYNRLRRAIARPMALAGQIGDRPSAIACGQRSALQSISERADAVASCADRICARGTAADRPPSSCSHKQHQKSEETHEQAISVRLRLGRGRRRRADDLRRVRVDAVAGGVPAADFARDGLVAQRRVGGGHDRLSCDGTGGIFLGRAVRPVRHPHRRIIRHAAARRRADRGEPGHQPVAVPVDVRRPDWRCGRQFLCADGGGGERLDRTPPQPRGCAGVGRHGGFAADGRPVRELADHDL